MYGRGYRIPGPIRLLMLLFFASIWVPMGFGFFSGGINPFWGDPGDQLRRQEQRIEHAHAEATRTKQAPPTQGTANERRAQKHEHHADGAFYRDEHPELADAGTNDTMWIWLVVALGSLLTAMGAMAAAVWTLLYPDPPRDPEELLEEALRS